MEVVKTLVAAGADIFAVNSEQQRPIDLARDSNVIAELSPPLPISLLLSLFFSFFISLFSIELVSFAVFENFAFRFLAFAFVSAFCLIFTR